MERVQAKKLFFTDLAVALCSKITSNIKYKATNNAYNEQWVLNSIHWPTEYANRKYAHFSLFIAHHFQQHHMWYGIRNVCKKSAPFAPSQLFASLRLWAIINFKTNRNPNELHTLRKSANHLRQLSSSTSSHTQLISTCEWTQYTLFSECACKSKAKSRQFICVESVNIFTIVNNLWGNTIAWHKSLACKSFIRWARGEFTH